MLLIFLKLIVIELLIGCLCFFIFYFFDHLYERGWTW